jgi:hypothetical protein
LLCQVRLGLRQFGAIVFIVILRAGRLAHVLKVGDGDDCNMARHIADKGVIESEAMAGALTADLAAWILEPGPAARLPPTPVNSKLCRCR